MTTLLMEMCIATAASSLTSLADSVVVYAATNGSNLAIRECTAETTFSTGDPTRDVIDVNLQNTPAADYLRSGQTEFRECVRSRPVLALGDNGFTQAVIDYAAGNLAAGFPYTDVRVNEVCRHHVRRCFALTNGSPSSASGTAMYNLTITYHGQAYDYPIHMEHCPYHYDHSWADASKPALLRRCLLNETVMGIEFHAAVQQAEGTPGLIARDGRYAWAAVGVCSKQNHVCSAIPEYNEPLSPGCQEVLPKCRAALKHLDAMMIRADPDEQQCNNFALKSMRGYFHDFQTADIEGSILWELHMPFNNGLCRWGQYVNALSDATGCDPGSIIAMAGQLSYKACGIDMWAEGGEGRLTPMHVGRGYECKANFNPNIDYTDAQGNVHRQEQYDDLELSANATAMENFWWALNGHYNPITAQLFYATQAWAITHAVGRVTCPITGQVSKDGTNPHEKKRVEIRPGFFTSSVRDPKTKGMANLQRSYVRAMEFLRDTQCDETTTAERDRCLDEISKYERPFPNAGPAVSAPCARKPTGAVRRGIVNDTNLNTLGGTCGMPQHFHGSITVRVPGDFQQVGSRFVDVVESMPMNMRVHMHMHRGMHLYMHRSALAGLIRWRTRRCRLARARPHAQTRHFGQCRIGSTPMSDTGAATPQKYYRSMQLIRAARIASSS